MSDEKKPGPWHQIGGGWYRCAMVSPNITLHVYEEESGVWRWSCMYGLPGICADEERGEASSMEIARAMADDAAKVMIMGLVERTGEAIRMMRAGT